MRVMYRLHTHTTYTHTHLTTHNTPTQDRRTFSRKPPPGGGQRTFVTFVLDPLYKIYSTIMGEHDASVKSMMEELVRVIGWCDCGGVIVGA